MYLFSLIKAYVRFLIIKHMQTCQERIMNYNRDMYTGPKYTGKSSYASAQEELIV